MIRLVILLLISASVTFGLFALMTKLIANAVHPLEEKPIIIAIEAVMPEKDSKIRTIDPLITPPPPPQPQYCDVPQFCEASKMRPFEVNNTKPNTDSTAPLIIEFSGPDADIFPNFTLSFGLLNPIIRVDPVYPAQAARDGREGWVRLSFTITETGDVEDVKVIDSQPRHIFDNAAQRALKKWKFRPGIRDGRVAKLFNNQVQLNFSLDRSR